MTRPRAGALALIAALIAACSAPVQTMSPRPAATARPVESPLPEISRSARWIYTDRVGAIFDSSPPAPVLPGSEPALLDGVRVMVSNGIVDGWARSGERLIGFRRLPARLGGGYALWSDARTYRADTFLGELTVLAEIGASGGIRPWIGALLLRTNVGSLLLDPATHALRRAELPGLADAIAIDDRRAVRLDELGRAGVTVDGGATWTDVLASRGVLTSGLEERDDGGVTLQSTRRPTTALVFDREGHLGEPPASPRSPPSPAVHARLLTDLPTSGRALPDETLARALITGAELPGDRWLTAREGGLQILAGATALPLDDADLLDVDEKLSRCQPITLGEGAVLLACAGESGAEVLSLTGPLGRSRLEATFPEQGLFVTGPHDRLGFVGRCGPLPPTSGDLGPATARPEEMTEAVPSDLASPTPQSPDLSPRVEPSLPEDARYCARISADRWVERRLRGDDARALYRFVPGDEGRVTALLLGSDKASPEVPLPAHPAAMIGEGIRIIRLDSDDPALGGAAYPAVPSLPAEAGYHLMDTAYWEDDDGAIRGWVRLPAPGEAPSPHPASAQGPARRKLRVDGERGGRSAGIRIDREGRAQIFPLPDGVTEVVPGGRFGLAQAIKDGNATTWETVDGGHTWARVEGPPIGTLAPPPDDSAPHGCSAIGCTWGAGIVRLGWGSPPPGSDVQEETGAPAAASPTIRGPRPLKITCSVEADAALWSAAPIRAARPLPIKASPIPISLRLGGSSAIGLLGAGGKWTGEVWSPFQPAAAVRRVSAADRSLNTVQGAVIPLLSASPRDPVDLLLSVGKRRLRVGAGASSFLPFDIGARIAVVADGPDGELVALDADKGVVWIARGDAVSPALRLNRVLDASHVRFTLGRRVSGGLVVVGYSITTGEVVAGDLDLARAEVGPLVALGAIDTLTDGGAPACAAPKGAIRFLADLFTNLRVTGKGSALLQGQDGLASFLIEATPERLCASGMEVGFPRGKPADLTARFGRGGGAAVRTPARIVKGSCAVDSTPR